ncbi:MAG: DUF5055 domain-containing protein, partial [Ruminococcus sp.]|nr:DUF5055 domain-containing protein [Ruminococcus sp.]
MAKTIKFKGSDGKEYLLEFTRKSVKTMERQGFRIDEIDSKPMTVLPALFAGAFLAHHKFVKPAVSDEISVVRSGGVIGPGGVQTALQTLSTTLNNVFTQMIDTKIAALKKEILEDVLGSLKFQKSTSAPNVS